MGQVIKKVFLAFLILMLVLVVLPVAAGVGVLAIGYSSGTVVVDVDDGNTDLTVPLPAGLVPLAMRFMPHEVCRELAVEVEPSWPAVRVAVDELDRIPDAVLVAVDSGDERVRVVKENGRIVVRVVSGEDHVNVTVPVRLVSSLVHQVERACF